MPLNIEQKRMWQADDTQPVTPAEAKAWAKISQHFLTPDEGIPACLRRLYWTEELSLNDISALTGINKSKIRDWFNKAGIPRRSLSDAVKQVMAKTDVPTRISATRKKQYADPEIGPQLKSRINTPKSRTKRAETYRKKYAENPELGRALAAAGQQYYEAETRQKIATALGVGVDEIHDSDLKAALIAWHHHEHLPVEQIARSMGISGQTLSRIMNDLQVEVRGVKHRQAEHRALVRQADAQGLMSRLDEREQIVLYGLYPTYDFKGMTIKKLAAYLDLPASVVYKARDRAIQKLKDRLEQLK